MTLRLAVDFYTLSQKQKRKQQSGEIGHHLNCSFLCAEGHYDISETIYQMGGNNLPVTYVLRV